MKTPRSSDPDDPELRKAPAAFRTVVKIASQNWEFGRLIFVLPSGRELRIEGAQPGPEARLIVNDFRFVQRVLAGGDIGFGEGFMAGEWDTPDLSALLEAFTAQPRPPPAAGRGRAFVRAVNFLAHALHRNSRSGSRRNILAHYDLGNAFYSRWLDPSMTYSSARFERAGPAAAARPSATSTPAWRASIGLGPDNHVLEIGCGWGGFAEFAAGEVGAKVTGITISPAQYDFAKQADVRAGPGRARRHPADRLSRRRGPVRPRRLDRDVRGGRRGTTGRPISARSATCSRPAAAPACRSSPSATSCSPTTGAAPTSSRSTSSRAACCRRRRGCSEETDARRPGVARHRPLRPELRRHPAPNGRSGFEAAWDDIRGLGFDERFRRLWRFYLGYCEAGFRTERTNVVQLSLTKS